MKGLSLSKDLTLRVGVDPWVKNPSWSWVEACPNKALGFVFSKLTRVLCLKQNASL